MLTSVPRGAVSNIPRATQARDFTGLRYGEITPTDIDGMIDYHDKCYVAYEAKHKNAPSMTQGQKLFFERLCDDLEKAKKPTLVIVFEHEFPANQPIDFAVCYVKKYRYKGAWKFPTLPVTVKTMSDKFIERFGK